MIYKLYTDGATSNNGYENSYGGWAWALVSNDRLLKFDSDGIAPATNNICELTALIKGCRAAETELEFGDIVLVYSDSAYAINCYKQKWYKSWQRNGWVNSKKQPVANAELWAQLIPFFEHPNFKFEKIAGHQGHEWNEYVDRLAVKAKSKFANS